MTGVLKPLKAYCCLQLVVVQIFAIACGIFGISFIKLHEKNALWFAFSGTLVILVDLVTLQITFASKCNGKFLTKNAMVVSTRVYFFFLCGIMQK